MADPNLVASGLSQEIEVDGIPFAVEIYRLEHDSTWTLEVVDENGTSTVWDDQFSSDLEALMEAQKVIRTEGVRAFRDGNVIPFRR